eukprot:scaffold23398_cov58-Attheya_sp.AAC.4
MQAAKETIAGNGRISKDWFKTSEIKLNRSIGLRNHWYNVLATTSVPKARERCKEARSNLKREIKKAKVKWYEDRAEEIRAMYFDPKNAWKAIKEIRDGFEGHHKAQSDLKMRKPNGEIATSDAESADMTSAHFKKGVKRDLGDSPTTEEVKLALRKAANGKSPGESRITAELPKALDNELLQDILLGKDYVEPNNWRGICLAEIPAKIQSSIISTRLLGHLGKLSIGIETQCECVPGKGCADALFSMKCALQIRKQHEVDTWVIFVNLVKAFDTVDHSLVFEFLKRYGILENLIKVIVKMYKGSTVILKSGQKMREIPYEIGVKQGDNMAPVLFI